MERIEDEQPWAGRKTTTVVIRLTDAEKAELEKAVVEHAENGIGRYLMKLHHQRKGRLKVA